MKKKEKFLLILAMTEFGRVTKSICQIWTCLVKDFLVVAGGSCNVESQYEKKRNVESHQLKALTYYILVNYLFFRVQRALQRSMNF